MLTRLLAFLRFTSTMRLRAWFITTLTSNLNVDVGWVLSEDRQKVHFEIYLRRRDASPYAGHQAKIVTHDVPLEGNTCEWALMGFDWRSDEPHGSDLPVIKARDFVDSNRKFR